MSDAIYCFDTATVRFAIYPQGPAGERVVAEIGEDPLRDLFGAAGASDTLIDAYHANCEIINMLALERHQAVPGAPVRLETIDFEANGRLAAPPSVIRASIISRLVAGAQTSAKPAAPAVPRQRRRAPAGAQASG